MQRSSPLPLDLSTAMPFKARHKTLVVSALSRVPERGFGVQTCPQRGLSTATGLRPVFASPAPGSFLAPDLAPVGLSGLRGLLQVLAYTHCRSQEISFCADGGQSCSPSPQEPMSFQESADPKAASGGRTPRTLSLGPCGEVHSCFYLAGWSGSQEQRMGGGEQGAWSRCHVGLLTEAAMASTESWEGEGRPRRPELTPGGAVLPGQVATSTQHTAGDGRASADADGRGAEATSAVPMEPGPALGAAGRGGFQRRH
ncbi:hypothetical protein CB1_000480004 [Camelus ferus]|nr:hypothetical protein CB1_000480004 [Camelus ferus]